MQRLNVSYVPTAAQLARHEQGGGARRRGGGDTGAKPNGGTTEGGERKKSVGEGEERREGEQQSGSEENEPELHVREKPKKAKVKPTISKSSKEVLSCTTAPLHDDDGDENVAASYVAFGNAKAVLLPNPTWKPPFVGEEMRVSIDGSPHSGRLTVLISDYCHIWTYVLWFSSFRQAYSTD